MGSNISKILNIIQLEWIPKVVYDENFFFNFYYSFCLCVIFCILSNL